MGTCETLAWCFIPRSPPRSIYLSPVRVKGIATTVALSHVWYSLNLIEYHSSNFYYLMSHSCHSEHIIISCECMRLNGKALQLHVVYKKLYYLLQLTRESVSVLKVTRESVSGTASHARCV